MGLKSGKCFKARIMPCRAERFIYTVIKDLIVVSGIEFCLAHYEKMDFLQMCELRLNLVKIIIEKSKLSETTFYLLNPNRIG